MRTILEDTIYTSLIPASGVQTTGTVVSTTFVSVNPGESNVIRLSIGTVTAGSITTFEVLSGTAATPGASTAVVGSVVLSATSGMYAVEIRSNQLTGATQFIGARYFIPAGGSAIASVDLERSNLRNMPPSNGLSGSAFFLA